jgi:hypothetical protein
MFVSLRRMRPYSPKMSTWAKILLCALAATATALDPGPQRRPSLVPNDPEDGAFDVERLPSFDGPLPSRHRAGCVLAPAAAACCAVATGASPAVGSSCLSHKAARATGSPGRRAPASARLPHSGRRPGGADAGAPRHPHPHPPHPPATPSTRLGPAGMSRSRPPRVGAYITTWWAPSPAPQSQTLCLSG